MPQDQFQPAETAPTVAQRSLRTSIWRFLSIGWMLAEPMGDQFSIRAEQARNRERLERWLPHYVKVHTTLAAIFLTGFVACDALEAPTLLLITFTTLFGAEVAVLTGLLGAYLSVRHPDGEDPGSKDD